jgi:hypothetical protein
LTQQIQQKRNETARNPDLGSLEALDVLENSLGDHHHQMRKNWRELMALLDQYSV